MNPDYDNDETTQNINDIERVLGNIGISIRDSNLEFREFDDVLADVADRWITLDSVTQNAIATAFAGVRQRESFAVLINNMDKYNELLEVSQTSAGTAERKYEAYYESIEAYQKRLQAAWEKLANDANIRDFMKIVYEFTTGLVKHLPTILRYLTMFVTTTQGYKIPQLFTTLGNFFSPGIGALGIDTKNFKSKKIGTGIWNSINGKNYWQDIKKYYGVNETKPIKGNELTQNTNTIQQNTEALKANTAALSGSPQGTSISSSSSSNYLSVLNKYRNKDKYELKDGILYYKVGPHAGKPVGGKANSEQISKEYNDALAQEQKDLERQAKEEEELLKIRKKNERKSIIGRAGGAAIAGVTASLTARKTVEVDGETYEMSSDAKAMSKTLSGVATGTGSLISPMVGMLAGTFADLITGPIAKAIDGAKIAAEQYRKELERSISVIQKVNSSFSTLTKISTSRLSRPEDIREMEAAMDEIRRTYNADENKSLRDLLIANFNKITGNQETTIAGLLDISNLTAEEQENRFYQLALAQKMTENDEQLAQLNDQYAKLGEEANEASRNAQGIGTTAAGWAATGAGAGVGLAGTSIGALIGGIFLPGIGHLAGAIVGGIVGAAASVAGAIEAAEATYDNVLKDIASDEFGDKPINEQIDDLQKILDEDAALSEEDRLLSQEQRDIAESSLNQLKSIRQDMKSNQEQQDALKVQEAMLSAKINGQYLGQLSTRQKSLYGVDELYRAIADQLVASGDLSGASVYNDPWTKELSSYGKRVIRTQLMQNEEYAKILKGELYTLEDIYNLPTTGGDYSRTAAGASKQAELLQKYGVSSLGELSSKVNTYYSNARILEQRANDNKVLDDYQNKVDAALEKSGFSSIDELLAFDYINDGTNRNSNNSYKTSGQAAGLGELKEEVKGYLEEISKIKSQLGIDNLDTGGKTIDELTEDLAAVNDFVAENQFNRELRKSAMQAVDATNEEEFKEIIKEFGDMTTADFGLTSAQNVEKIREINSMMSEIASSAKSWSEKTNDIIAKFPSLIKYVNNADQLQKKLLDKTIQYSKIQINQQFKSIMGNEEYFATSFKEAMEQISLNGRDAYTEFKDKYKDFNGVNDLESLLQWRMKNQDATKEDIELIDKLIEQEIGATELVSDAQKELRNSVISYTETLMDKEISNLQEQKSALSEITSQREYENKLIEAKLKLENAQKEKKRIWREGVGWVYEADQNAVADAQKELDELNTQKKISDIDLQITQLEADKKMLSDISREEELEQQKALFDAWVRKYNETSGTLNSDMVNNIYAAAIDENSTLNTTIGKVGALIDDWKKRWIALEGKDTEEREEAWSAYIAAKEQLDDAKAAVAAEGGDTDTNRAALSKARTNYNTALTNWRNAYTASQNAGYTNKEDYTDSDSSSVNSTAALEAAVNGQEEYDNREEWWLPNYFIDGKSGHSQYQIDWDGNPKTPTDKEWKAILDDLESRVYHEAVLWDAGHESNPIDVDKEYGDRQFTDDERDEFYGSVSNLKSLLASKYRNGVLWTNDQGVWRVKEGNLYKMIPGGKVVKSNSLGDNMLGGHIRGSYVDSIPTYSTGTLNTSSGLNLINEFGTEAIITPQGTLTALPSKTGIIPADITSNLWQLGELAPSILRTMLIGSSDPNFNKNSQVVDESFNINGLNMTINADDTFDINRFVNAIKNQAALTKNK